MLAPVSRTVRDSSGLLLVLAALGALFYAVVQLRAHDYLSSILVIVVGVSLLWAGVELLRPSIGE
jgi:apolipoprotein N-acyltransferase